MEKVQSYGELLQDAQRILAGLKKLGLKSQDQIIFQLEDNQDFLCSFWACVLGGFVPVPISIAPTYEQVNTTTRKLQNTWQMLGKPLVLTSASLVQNIDGFSRLLNLENFQVATIDQLRECEPDLNWHQSQPEDLAILFLTSGSTGIPKCVMLNHRNLLSMSAGLVFMGDFSSQESILNWMPLDHVGALVSRFLRN
ncbi:MAG: AMP-binding protein [Nostoc sp.]